MTPIPIMLTPEDEAAHAYNKTWGGPDYLPLPAVQWLNDPQGKVLTEWQLDEDERKRIAAGENIRLVQYTFNKPLQPVALMVTKDE